MSILFFVNLKIPIIPSYRSYDWINLSLVWGLSTHAGYRCNVALKLSSVNFYGVTPQLGSPLATHLPPEPAGRRSWQPDVGHGIRTKVRWQDPWSKRWVVLMESTRDPPFF